MKHLLVVVLAIIAGDAFGGSAMVSSEAGRSEPSASLGFTIVIPAVLILDPRSGNYYSNDAKAIVSIGALGTPRAAMQAGQRPVVAVNAGRLVEGEVICTP